MFLIKWELIALIAFSSFFLLADEDLKSNPLPTLLAENSSAENKLNSVIQEQIKNHQKEGEHQKKVSNLAEDTRDIRSDYQITLRQLENAKAYNAQLKKLIQSQEEEKLSIREQITEVKQTSKEITPLMLEMIDNLEKFTSLDMPFLQKERQGRIKKLKEIMDRADVSISEKYRRILSAYQTENDYGKTIEVYQDFHQVQKDKKQHTNYLRVGRIALVYQSLDGKNQGYWNQYKKTWEPLSSRYKKSIEKGIKIAKKQQAPDLLILPVPAPLEKL